LVPNHYVDEKNTQNFVITFWTIPPQIKSLEFSSEPLRRWEKHSELRNYVLNYSTADKKLGIWFRTICRREKHSEFCSEPPRHKTFFSVKNSDTSIFRLSVLRGLIKKQYGVVTLWYWQVHIYLIVVYKRGGRSLGTVQGKWRAGENTLKKILEREDQYLYVARRTFTNLFLTVTHLNLLRAVPDLTQLSLENIYL
jgi:hypothetical protein